MEYKITPSLMLEYLYCPRFIYFMMVLVIDQREDQRYKVTEGREIHLKKRLENADYTRKKIGVVRKINDCELHSDKYNIYGIVDEVLFLKDGTASPLDYKYAEYKDKVFKTYKIQSIMYSLLIRENFSVDSFKGYIVYTRSKNHLEEILYTNKDYDFLFSALNDIHKIIDNNFFPSKTKVKVQCSDCCYRNICMK